MQTVIREFRMNIKQNYIIMTLLKKLINISKIKIDILIANHLPVTLLITYLSAEAPTFYLQYKNNFYHLYMGYY